MEKIFKAAKELDKIKRHATALVLFTNDRELLECSSCGTWEDVASDGVLIVYQKDDSLQEDSGLRFGEVDEGHFECPKCKTLIAVVTVDDCKNAMSPADAGDMQRCKHE
jgi:hypothetical protein